MHGPLSIDRLKDNRESLLDDETIDENETFFCSELVAAALKEIDILPRYTCDMHVVYAYAPQNDHVAAS